MYGLQIFDASGNVLVDVVDRLTRLHSKYILTVPANSSVFITVSGMTTDGKWALLPGDPMFIGCTVESGGFLVKNPLSSPLDTIVTVMMI